MFVFCFMSEFCVAINNDGEIIIITISIIIKIITYELKACFLSTPSIPSSTQAVSSKYFTEGPVLLPISDILSVQNYLYGPTNSIM